MDGKAPLVESMGEDQRHRRITFVWRASNETTRVTMMGGLPGANLLKPLTRLADTDLWYLTETHSTEARFQYVFQINGPETLPMEMSAIMTEMQRNPPRLDPLNTQPVCRLVLRRVAGCSSTAMDSQASRRPAGRKSTGEVQESDSERRISPEHLHAARLRAGQASLLADDCLRRRLPNMDATLDNLLAAGKIPPLVVVGVQNISQQTRHAGPQLLR